jgi:hypothetical protein
VAEILAAADHREEGIRGEEGHLAAAILAEVGHRGAGVLAEVDRLVVAIPEEGTQVEGDRREEEILVADVRLEAAIPEEEDRPEEGTLDHRNGHQTAPDLGAHRSGGDHQSTGRRTDGVRMTARGCIVTICGIWLISIWPRVRGSRLEASFRTTTFRI